MSCVLYSIVTSKVWYLMKLCEVDNSHRIYSHAKTTFAHVLTNNYVTRGDDSSLTTTIHHLVHPCGCVSLSMHVHTYIGHACIHVHQWVNMRLKKLMYANGLIMSLYSCSPIGRNNDIYMCVCVCVCVRARARANGYIMQSLILGHLLYATINLNITWMYDGLGNHQEVSGWMSHMSGK